MQNTQFMTPLTADYIVGFTDGEGCFSLHITKRTQNQFGFCFSPSFSLSQNTSSKQVLEDIQLFFQCGFLRKDRETSKYEVRDLQELLEKSIPFFEKNKLTTQKNQDFLLFCEICNLLKKKKHLELSGVLTLIDLAYSMNNTGKNRRKTKQQLLSEMKTKPTNL